MREKIALVSTGTRKDGKPTATIRTTYKNRRNTPDKLALKKFDPLAYDKETDKVGKHVLFKEKKIKK